MNWGGWSGFFAMGGYALYVWGALAMVLAALAAEVLALARRRKKLLARHAHRQAAARGGPDGGAP